MELKNINQAELDGLAAYQTISPFLQSFAWGEFHRALNHRVWRWGVFKDEKLIAGANVIEHSLPLGQSYLYCPRGPITDPTLSVKEKNECLSLILSKVRDLTIATTNKEEIFFRFEPTWDIANLEMKVYESLAIQPKHTAILNLELSETEILNNCKPKTRYNIRLAEKKNVTIEHLPTNSFNEIWPLFLKTAGKQNFNLHPQSYYQTMLAQLPFAELWVVRNQEKKIIAGNLMIFFGSQVTYLHGASDYDDRQLMAPYLLHWEMIKMAKQRGFKSYDFYGIGGNDSSTANWAGFSRFKEGFGATPIALSGTFDFLYNKTRYRLYQTTRKIGRKIRAIFK